MNKPLFISLISVTLLSTNIYAESMYERFQTMQKELETLKQEVATLKEEKNSKSEMQKDADEESDAIIEIKSKNEESEEDDLEETLDFFDSRISKLNRATSGNRLKLGADYRFTLDNIKYTMADKSKAKNDALMTNRLWVNMFWKANNELSFHAQVAYQKAYGARSGASNPASSSYENFDWITNENAYDGLMRLKNAYFFYQNDTFASLDIPWTFSIGRRPSTNGHLINFRDNDGASSPMAHTVNVEFDGLSSKFSLLKDWGTYVKFCAGRGMSNAAPKFSTTPYSETTDIPEIDLVGLIFVPFNNGHYSFNTQYYYANNLIDSISLTDQSQGFDTVGGLHSFTANIMIQGIGNEWSEFLDDSTLFISGAYTKTNPKNNKRMLYGAVDAGGATQTGESKIGYSYWIGTQFPSLISKDGKWGLEFNHGSQYFRSITYAEDTNIGSKVAVRGDAYEAYFTEYLVEKYLSMQIRYTYIDYDYTGSNGFFGETSGASYSIEDAINF
ncbi:MAG: DUF3373 family protein, partial [Thiovulaceae bacterium]|nr:DUF3373 family protein [Sulfurimonadaceae bacterium]